jgi:hypothetical protein
LQFNNRQPGAIGRHDFNLESAIMKGSKMKAPAKVIFGVLIAITFLCAFAPFPLRAQTASGYMSTIDKTQTKPTSSVVTGPGNGNQTTYTPTGNGGYVTVSTSPKKASPKKASPKKGQGSHVAVSHPSPHIK